MTPFLPQMLLSLLGSYLFTFLLIPSMNHHFAYTLCVVSSILKWSQLPSTPTGWARYCVIKRFEKCAWARGEQNLGVPGLRFSVTIIPQLLSSYTKGQPLLTRGHGNLQALGHMPWEKGRHRRMTAMKFLSRLTE